MCIEGWGRYCDFGGRDLYNIPHFREHINSSIILSIVIYNSHTNPDKPPLLCTKQTKNSKRQPFPPATFLTPSSARTH